MHFYSLLFSQAWRICLAWMASYSLGSKIIFGGLFGFGVALAESLLWRRVAPTPNRMTRWVMSAVLGPLVVLIGMYLISLFCYAPSAVLQDSVRKAANSAHAEAERNCQMRQASLSKEASSLRAEIQSDPYARKLVQAQHERDVALHTAAEATNFANQIVQVADDLKKSEQEFEEAINRQSDAYENFLLMGTGLMDLKPSISENDAMEQHKQYLNFKTQAALAKSKVHEKAEALQVIELNR